MRGEWRYENSCDLYEFIESVCREIVFDVLYEEIKKVGWKSCEGIKVKSKCQRLLLDSKLGSDLPNSMNASAVWPLSTSTSKSPSQAAARTL